MLSQLNRFTDKHGSTVGWCLLIVLIVPLVFVFGQSDGCYRFAGGGGLSDPGFGTMFGRNISEDEFTHHLYGEAISYYLQTGRQVDLSQVYRQQNVERSAPRVLFRLRALQLAKEQGYDQVSDEELATFKRNQECFKVDGKFSPERYKQFAQNFFEKQPIQMAEFDTICRENIVLNRFQERAQSELSSDAELRLQVIAEQKPEYVWKEISSSSYMAQQTVSDEEVKKQFDNLKSSTYKIPEQRTAKLAVFPIHLNPDAKVTPETLQEFYLNRYGKVTASHILFSFKGAGSKNQERTKDAARKLAEEVLAKVRAPKADFAALAKEYSDCPSSEKGGDLGEFEFGRMVRPFSQTAFKMKVGEISDLVESEFGFHIIKKTAQSEKEPFAKVEAEVRSGLLEELDRAFVDQKVLDSYNQNKATQYTKKQASFTYLRIPRKTDGTEDEKKLDAARAANLFKEAAAVSDLSLFGQDYKKKNEKTDITWGTRPFVDVDADTLEDYLKKARELPLNKISELIELPEAFYVVQKTAERNEVPFDEVKSSLSMQMRNDLRASAETVAMDLAQKLADKMEGMKSAEALAKLEAEAKEMGIELIEAPAVGSKSTNYLSNVGGGVSARVLHQNISELTLEKAVGKPFKSRSVLLPVLVKLQPARDPELAEVKDEITTDLKKGKAVEAAQKGAQEMYEKIKADLEKTGSSKLVDTFTKPREMQDPRYQQYLPEPEKKATALASSTAVGKVAIQNTDVGSVLVYVKAREQSSLEDLESQMNYGKMQQKQMKKYMTQFTYQESLEKRYPFAPADRFKHIFEPKPQEAAVD